MARIKVLIVEDELLARIGLHQLVNWELMNLDLLEDAKDGQEALERIRENCPDIIILDLNIPKINGLQILEYINENGLSCRTIVVSCNEEFEMVKDSMKLGAFDYLRKLNLSAEELTGILKNCLEKISGEKSDNAVLTDTKKGNQEQKFRQEIKYEAIISGSGNSLFHYADAYCTALCILNQKQSSEGNIYRTADYVKKEFDRNQLDYVQIVKGNQYCCFLFTKKFSDDWYHQLHNQLEKHDSGKCYFGIYESDMQDNSQIHEGISMAEQVVYFSYYDEEQQIHRVWQKLSCSEHSPKLIHSALTVLRNEVGQFHREESIRMIQRIIEIISVEKYTHINVLRRIFMDILGIYSMTAQTLNGSIEEIAVYGDNCHYQKIMMMNSLQAVEQWLIEFENVFCEYFWIRYKCSQS
ncbi:MAG: response regulator, partial [Lachnospiraceae bacterium]|nr:response regulator [Lachnospiraceae bacterium]